MRFDAAGKALLDVIPTILSINCTPNSAAARTSASFERVDFVAAEIERRLRQMRRAGANAQGGTGSRAGGDGLGGAGEPDVAAPGAWHPGLEARRVKRACSNQRLWRTVGSGVIVADLGKGDATKLTHSSCTV